MGMSWGDYNKISQNLLFLVNSGWQLDSYHLATILAQLPILLQILQVLRQSYIPEYEKHFSQNILTVPSSFTNPNSNIFLVESIKTFICYLVVKNHKFT